MVPTAVGAAHAIQLAARNRKRTRQTAASHSGGGSDRAHAAAAHLCCGGLNGFVRLVNAHLGYDPHNAMSVGIPVHQNTHGTWEDRSAYFYNLRERIASLPGVLEAGIWTNATPPDNGSD